MQAVNRTLDERSTPGNAAILPTSFATYCLDRLNGDHFLTPDDWRLDSPAYRHS